MILRLQLVSQRSFHTQIKQCSSMQELQEVGLISMVILFQRVVFLTFVKKITVSMIKRNPFSGRVVPAFLSDHQYFMNRKDLMNIFLRTRKKSICAGVFS